MNIPLSLTGTFSEIRTNHFHAGIDIPTNKKLDTQFSHVLTDMFQESKFLLGGLEKLFI